MPWYLTDLVFTLLRLIGALLILSALFLYEDEEGKIQNKVEQWWIKLSDKALSSRSRVTSFMQEVAKLTSNGFDRLLGERLVSLRFTAVSICFSLASCFLLGFLVLPFVHNPQPNVTPQRALLLFFFFTSFGIIPGVFKDRLVHGIWWGLIIAVLLQIIGFLRFVVSTKGLGPALRGSLYVTLPFGFSFLCDLAYIVFTRWILRRISQIDRPYEIMIQVIANFLFLIVLTLVPIFLGVKIGKYSAMAGGALTLSFVLNSIDFFAGSAGLVVAVVLLVHRLFWPALQRPLYAIQRFVPLQKRGWLWGLGVFLLILPKPKHLNVALLKSILYGLQSGSVK